MRLTIAASVLYYVVVEGFHWMSGANDGSETLSFEDVLPTNGMDGMKTYESYMMRAQEGLMNETISYPFLTQEVFEMCLLTSRRILPNVTGWFGPRYPYLQVLLPTAHSTSSVNVLQAYQRVVENALDAGQLSKRWKETTESIHLCVLNVGAQPVIVSRQKGDADAYVLSSNVAMVVDVDMTEEEEDSELTTTTTSADGMDVEVASMSVGCLVFAFRVCVTSARDETLMSQPSEWVQMFGTKILEPHSSSMLLPSSIMEDRWSWTKMEFYTDAWGNTFNTLLEEQDSLRLRDGRIADLAEVLLEINGAEAKGGFHVRHSFRLLADDAYAVPVEFQASKLLDIFSNLGLPPVYPIANLPEALNGAYRSNDYLSRIMTQLPRSKELNLSSLVVRSGYIYDPKDDNNNLLMTMTYSIMILSED